MLLPFASSCALSQHRRWIEFESSTSLTPLQSSLKGFIALALLFAHVAASAGTLEKGDFRVTYDERGVTGLANPRDPFGADMVARGQRLGLIVKYRTGNGDWQDITNTEPQLTASPGDALSATPAAWQSCRSKSRKPSPRMARHWIGTSSCTRS